MLQSGSTPSKQQCLCVSSHTQAKWGCTVQLPTLLHRSPKPDQRSHKVKRLKMSGDERIFKTAEGWNKELWWEDFETLMEFSPISLTLVCACMCDAVCTRDGFKGELELLWHWAANLHWVCRGLGRDAQLVERKTLPMFLGIIYQSSRRCQTFFNMQQWKENVSSFQHCC